MWRAPYTAVIFLKDLEIYAFMMQYMRRCAKPQNGGMRYMNRVEERKQHLISQTPQSI